MKYFRVTFFQANAIQPMQVVVPASTPGRAAVEIRKRYPGCRITGIREVSGR